MRSGEKICDHAGRDDLVGRKDHAADDALPRDRRAQPAAGIEEGEVGRRRMIFGQADIVPPGNAVLGEHDGGVVAEQRLQAASEAPTPVAFKRADDDILRPERGRIVGSLDACALNSASPTRSVRPLALTAARCGPRITQETSCPASASRTAKWLPTAPAPKMHIRMRKGPAEGWRLAPVSTSLRRSATGHAIKASRVAESDGSMPDASRHIARRNTATNNEGTANVCQSGFVGTRSNAGSRRSRSTARRSTMPMMPASSTACSRRWTSWARSRSFASSS